MGLLPLLVRFLFLRSHQGPQLRQLFQVVPRGLLPQLPASVGVVRHLEGIGVIAWAGEWEGVDQPFYSKTSSRRSPYRYMLHAQMVRASCHGPCYVTPPSCHTRTYHACSLLPPSPPANEWRTASETYLRVEIVPHELVPPLPLVLRRLLLSLQVANALADLFHVQLLQPRVLLEGRKACFKRGAQACHSGGHRKNVAQTSHSSIIVGGVRSVQAVSGRDSIEARLGQAWFLWVSFDPGGFERGPD